MTLQGKTITLEEDFVARQALFAGLVYDDQDNPVTTAFVGGDAFYVINDDGFRRHVDAESVDRQVLAIFMEQLQANKDLAIEQALRMLGTDDLFAKAALDSTIDNLDMEQVIAHGIPSQARDMMGMMGFRIIINFHGELVELRQPSAPDEE